MRNYLNEYETELRLLNYSQRTIDWAQTELFNKTGSFFAFGQKQFEERRQEGVKYASLGCGLICPVDNVKTLTDGLNTIQEEAIEQDVKENGAEAIIQREYFNYETQISMNSSDATASLKKYKELMPDQFTDDLINAIFRKCFNMAVENDWF